MHLELPGSGRQRVAQPTVAKVFSGASSVHGPRKQLVRGNISEEALEGVSPLPPAPLVPHG